jgi:diaphanous 1
LTFGAKPYVIEQGPKVEALKGMAASLQKDLQSLLSYFGEDSETSEASKYEEFFAMIVGFSSSLQV